VANVDGDAGPARVLARHPDEGFADIQRGHLTARLGDLDREVAGPGGHLEHATARRHTFGHGTSHRIEAASVSTRVFRIPRGDHTFHRNALVRLLRRRHDVPPALHVLTVAFVREQL